MPKSKVRDEKGRFKPGHPSTHGAYAKKMPLAIRRESDVFRDGIIKDLGGIKNISTARLILVEKALNLYRITLAIENFINTNGVFKFKSLHPILKESYIAYVNSLRLTLREIGLERLEPGIKSIQEIIKEFDAEKEKSEGKADSQSTEDVVVPSSSEK